MAVVAKQTYTSNKKLHTKNVNVKGKSIIKRTLKVKSKNRVASKDNLAKVIKLPVGRIALKKKTARKTLTVAQKDRLIIDNREKATRLAKSLLKHWRARLEPDEMQSAVDLSLCEAVKNFSPLKGASFTTFLYYHLRGNLIRAISSAATAYGTLTLDNPVIDQALSNDHENCAEINKAFSSTSAVECLSDYEQPLPDEVCYKNEMMRHSRIACEQLDNLEKEVIIRVFLGEEQLLNIAKSLGYSRCHISRVKRKAIDTLFSELKRAGASNVNVEELVSVGNFALEDGNSSLLKNNESRKRITRRVMNKRHLAFSAVSGHYQTSQMAG